MHFSRVCSILMLLAVNASTMGQAIPSFIMVEHVGTGQAALNGNATQIYMETYLPTTGGQSGPLLQIEMPNTSIPTQKALTEAGSATAAGLFTRFTNGQGYAITGYDAVPGTANIAGTLPSAVNRIVGTIDNAYNVTTLTGYNTGTAEGIRSSASVDGSSFYVSIASTGLVYLGTPNVIQTPTPIITANPRQVRIFNNSLFYSTNTAITLAGTPGVLPTSAVTGTPLPGFSATDIHSFYMLDNPLNNNNWNGTGLDTLYFATNTTGVGVQRWVYNGTNWALSGSFNTTARGIAASIDTNGLVSIWYTTGATSNNNLVFLPDTLTDSGGTFGTATTLINSGTNSVFRGVDLDFIVSVPEPSTYALLAVVGFIALQWYLRRKPVAAVEVASSC